MINYRIPLDIIYVIMPFLDQEDIVNYDTAMCNKEFRPSFLEILKNRRFPSVNVCRWSLIRQLVANTEYCNYKNLKYVSNTCNNLSI